VTRRNTVRDTLLGCAARLRAGSLPLATAAAAAHRRLRACAALSQRITDRKRLSRALCWSSSALTAQYRCARCTCAPPAAYVRRELIRAPQFLPRYSNCHAVRSLHTPSWVGARLHHPTSVSRAGHAGGARRRSGEELRLGRAMSCMEPKHGASHASFRRRAPRKRCARSHRRCSASRLLARAFLSANACRPAAATEMADVHAVLVRRSGRTHLHDTSLRCVRAAHRAPARPVTRYWLLGCHWASMRRTPASFATLPVPRRSALASRVQRQRLRLCCRAATECST
jgi:hypothetical protein